ncbi:MAG: hypothetical protein KME29_03880 [Calothrix sp. FI2-JRJ7]|jgi:hypothetical protein|nr:hypothetical protein [Calothrix sp. FI2-JRJ7]MBW4598760.1 hypothetical protein [Calothrix sp. FI2-JRJ7]
MIGIDIAAAGFALCAIGMFSKLFAFVRKESKDAASERAMLQGELKIINWRIIRIERNLGIEQLPSEK